MKAILLDRDGTIIKEKNYLSSKKDIEFETGAISALKLLQENNYKLIIITNQSGIARGMFTELQFKELQEYILKLFKQENIDFLDYFFCPHHPTAGKGIYKKDCNCRKPKPGMLIDAINKYKIDIKASFMIGDKISDIKAGQNAGLKSILVQTGYGQNKAPDNIPPYLVAKNLMEAAKKILNNE
jgi:D,D-heptose 1,7-bisphosphate phosphatase